MVEVYCAECGTKFEANSKMAHLCPACKDKRKEQVLVPTGQYFCIGYDRFGKDKGVELYAVKNKNLPC